MSDPSDDLSKETGSVPSEPENERPLETGAHPSPVQDSIDSPQVRFRRLLDGDISSEKSPSLPDPPTMDDPELKDDGIVQESPDISETEPFEHDLTENDKAQAANPQEPSSGPSPELDLRSDAEVLPQRVPETDMGATQVGPSAYIPPTQPEERRGRGWRRWDTRGGCA